jgi:ribosomal protein L25 (general stress protein Ctc)
MRTVEIIGYKRANLGKSDAKKLRAEGHALAFCMEVKSKSTFIHR